MAGISKEAWSAAITKLMTELDKRIDDASYSEITKQFNDIKKPLPENMVKDLATNQQEIMMAYEALVFRLKNYKDYLKTLEKNPIYGTGAKSFVKTDEAVNSSDLGKANRVFNQTYSASGQMVNELKGLIGISPRIDEIARYCLARLAEMRNNKAGLWSGINNTTPGGKSIFTSKTKRYIGS